MNETNENNARGTLPAEDLLADELPVDNESGAPGFWEVVMSVLAAALGVQNSKNRERDFSKGNPLVFIAAGLIFTILFVLTLIGIVNLVL